MLAAFSSVLLKIHLFFMSFGGNTFMLHELPLIKTRKTVEWECEFKTPSLPPRSFSLTCLWW